MKSSRRNRADTDRRMAPLRAPGKRKPIHTGLLSCRQFPLGRLEKIPHHPSETKTRAPCSPSAFETQTWVSWGHTVLQGSQTELFWVERASQDTHEGFRALIRCSRPLISISSSSGTRGSCLGEAGQRILGEVGIFSKAQRTRQMSWFIPVNLAAASWDWSILYFYFAMSFFLAAEVALRFFAVQAGDLPNTMMSFLFSWMDGGHF